MRTGEIIKSANSGVSVEDMELINRYTRRKFLQDEVYVFSVVLCDNDIDRDCERFTVEALFELEKLFVGKTGICDHNPKAENQTARIFECRVEAVEEKRTQTGDDYFRLVARAYMPVCKGTEDVVMQIESGILKEVSVGCSVTKSVCSVCGADSRQQICGHKKGNVYGDKMCYFELSGITDAYEFSFVAVPAQREAGVIKNYSADLEKEYEDMNDIIKSLTVGDAVTLCVSDAKKLYEHIAQLERKAAQGEEYRQELKAEVLRLSAVAQPDIPVSTMKSAIEELTTSQLREFQKAFSKKRRDMLCPKPQLVPAKSGGTAKGNNEFRI